MFLNIIMIEDEKIVLQEKNSIRSLKAQHTGKKFREDNLDACWAFRERMEFFYKNNLAELYLKMNNIYCWYVLESLHKCYLNNISGEKLKLLLKQVKKDVVFLSDKEVNEEYLNAFKLISEKGLKKYEKTYRKQNEKG